MLKTVLTTIVGALLFQTPVLAQIHVRSNGVGIGTTLPTEKLHVAGRTLIESNDGNILNFSSSNESWQYLNFNKGGQRKAWMGLDAGNDFHIRSEQVPGHIWLQPFKGHVYIESNHENGNIGGALTIRNWNKNDSGEAMDWSIYNMKGGYGASLQFWAYGSFGSRPAVTFKDNGNVGIGTQTPEYKLQVAGIIKATSIRSDGGQSWPDYVFDSAYKLPSLPEVETFIQQNHHLPNVLSAETVKKDGIDLTDNQAVLLRKIEELTLYIIEQQKEIQALKVRTKDLEEKGK